MRKKIIRLVGNFSMVWHMLINRQLTLRKAINFMINIVACCFKRPPLKYPPVLMIDPANICNLRCTRCPTAMGVHPRPPGTMTLENFKKIIDETKSSTVLVPLYDTGEPFLNPEIYDMIEYLTKNRIASITCTNGHYFETDEKAERLVKSGLYSMIVSLSGATQEVHEKYHQRGNLSLVVENTKRVARAKKRLGRKTPHIRLRFLIMDHNEHELEEMKKLGKEMGGDVIDFRNAQPHYQPEEMGAQTEDTENIKQSEATPDRVCRWPWLISVVHWDGTVVPCCLFSLGLPELGNALQGNGFGGAWWGPQYEEFRKKMLVGKNQIPACRFCEAKIGYQDEFKIEDRTINLKRKQKVQ